MSAENPYQAPSDIVTGERSVFSREEWGYVGREFSVWVFLGSVVMGVYLTWQTNDALKSFGATGRSGGILTVSALRVVAPMVVLWAAWNALISAMRKRHENQRSISGNVAYVWGIFGFYAGYLLADLILVGACFMTAIGYYGGSSSEFWQSTQIVMLWGDLGFGLVALTIFGVFLGTIGVHLARLVARFRLWLPLRALILLVICRYFSSFISTVLAEVSSLWD